MGREVLKTTQMEDQMKAMNKQTVLTGVLLAVLAVNVSFKSETQSLDLASSEAVPGRTTPPPPPPPPADANAPVRIAPNAAVAGNSGPRPDAAAAPVAAASANTLTQEICNAEHSLRFAAEEKDGVSIVRAYVTRGDRQVLTAYKEGTMTSRFQNLEARAQFINQLVDAVEARSCANNVTIETPAAPEVSEESREAARVEAEERAERLARGQRNCTLDRQGRALRGDAKFTCNLERLEKIADMDESTDDEDSSRRSRRSENRASREFTSAVNALKSSIKSLLLSNNEDRQDEGIERMDEVIEALESVDDTGSISSRMIRSAIAQVRALETGARFNERSEQLAESYDRLDEQVESLRAQVRSAQDPWTSNSLGNQLRSLETQRDMMRMSVQNDSGYAQLNSLKSQDILSQSDFSDFTASYQELLAEITGQSSALVGSNPIAAIQIPQGAADFRSQLAQNGGRSLGMQTPVLPSSIATPQPQFAPGQYGLNTPPPQAARF